MKFSFLPWLVMLISLPAISLQGDLYQQPGPNESQGSSPADLVDPASSDLSWMPKVETGALRFLKQHPTADGRGVVVAIFDTGVDPGAVGLQTTTDGKPKVIDLIDGTGSGDVTTTKKVKPEQGKIIGLSGRELTISAEWKNPTGEYRIGLKSGYELFPSELIEVLRQEREEKFRQQEFEHLAELKRELRSWKKQHPDPQAEQKETEEELTARVELLAEMLQEYSDPGPIYDVIVYHDGTNPRVIVDTDEDGDLAEERSLTNFRLERGYSTFPDPINMNFAVNIYDDGNLVSIVADCGSHGTHVAGIVAAHFPDNPAFNGVAPGAQIVSVKIGDTRLDGMENGPGLVRGLKAVLDNNCDLINMSYGEPARMPNAGRIAELYSEIVEEHDVIFVSSAGNAGPALSTVGAPGGTTSAILGVGAHVSPEMMRSQYSLRETLGDLPYTWTSRGPTTDGDLGVDILAPGGAIAPVPIWTREVTHQMNGTSMASPNACGNIALLLSAAKQKNIKTNPAIIRKSLQNTAQPLPGIEVFAAGPGLLQVDRAWSYLEQHAASLAQQLTYELRVPSLNNGRGIYLREPYQTKAKTAYRVNVNARLKKQAPIAERIGVSVSLKLKSTADWVHCGDLLHLTHGGNRFEITVDPTELPPGVHYTELQACESGDSLDSPLFRLPITVVISEPVQNADATNWKNTSWFEPGVTKRHFFTVPFGATSCQLSMKLIDTHDQKFFRVHTLQLIDGEQFEQAESGTYYPMVPGIEQKHSFPVVGGRTLELDLAQYWTVLGNSKLEYEIKFYGIQPDDRSLTLTTGCGAVPVRVYNSLAAETLDPQGSLNIWRRTLPIEKSEIEPLSHDRDQLPNRDSVYELKLSSTLNLEAAGSVQIRFLPTEDLLYDAPVGPFIFHVFDKNGKRLVTNDMFPDTLKLNKGTYRVELVVQHHDLDRLQKLEKTPLTVDQTLSSAVSIKFWTSRTAAATGTNPFRSTILQPTASLTFYLAEPAASQLPAALKPGDQLRGKVTYSSDEETAAEFELVYLYCPGEPNAKPSSNSDEPQGTWEEKLQEYKLRHLKTLKVNSDEFQKLFVELASVESKNIEPLVIKLHKLDAEEIRKQNLEQIVQVADELIACFDQKELAGQLALKVADGDDNAKKEQQAAEKQKSQLIDVLHRKARAILYRELPDVVVDHPIVDAKLQDESVKQAVAALSRWVSLDEADYSLIKIRTLRREDKPAQAVLLLNKDLKKSPEFLHHKKRRDLFSELKWSAWEDWQNRQLLLEFPEKHPPY